jgi:hypothetical protein
VEAEMGTDLGRVMDQGPLRDADAGTFAARVDIIDEATLASRVTSTAPV